MANLTDAAYLALSTGDVSATLPTKLPAYSSADTDGYQADKDPTTYYFYKTGGTVNGTGGTGLPYLHRLVDAE